MKILRKGLALILAVLCAGVIPHSALATTTYAEHEGLEITVRMDKEQYEDEEPITATIVVENTNEEIVTIVNLEQLIPDGYRLSEDSAASMKDFEILPSEVIVLKVTFERDAPAVPEAAVPEDFFGKLLFGQTWGLPNLLLIMIAAIAIVIFMLLT